jgi:hypothetical protein
MSKDFGKIMNFNGAAIWRREHILAINLFLLRHQKPRGRSSTGLSPEAQTAYDAEVRAVLTKTLFFDMISETERANLKDWRDRKRGTGSESDSGRHF